MPGTHSHAREIPEKRRERRFRRLRAGLRADLVLVEGDPTRDILATRSIAGIWKLGRRVDREGYRAGLGSGRRSLALLAAAAALVLIVVAARRRASS